MIRDRIKKLKRSHKGITPLESNKGATAVEYAIMLALVAGVIFTAVGSLGSIVQGLFESASRGW
jgi:Flp pilus assembly pilin Flp